VPCEVKHSDAGIGRLVEGRVVVVLGSAEEGTKQPTNIFPWLKLKARATEDVNKDKDDQVVFTSPVHVDNEEVMSWWWAKLRGA
jgi:hypothetical protein